MSTHKYMCLCVHAHVLGRTFEQAGSRHVREPAYSSSQLFWTSLLDSTLQTLKGSLKTAMMGIFTPQKSATATNQGFYFFSEKVVANHLPKYHLINLCMYFLKENVALIITCQVTEHMQGKDDSSNFLLLILFCFYRH